MGVFNNWPYTDVHQLNLDWILSVIKEVKEKMDLIDQTVSDLEGYVTSCSDSADLAEGYKNQADGYQQDAKGYRDGAEDWYNQTVALLAGSPKVVDLVADMTDTDLIYVYVGSEVGYTAGNWYYYDGNDWVDGGTYGATGMADNARNLLKYILERVAFTEAGMDVYVNALYDALEQIHHVTASYTITNALSHVTNSNSATGANNGDLYTATLTAEAGYTLSTVTVTMGGVDVTSGVYDSGTHVITITNVTGDIVITASALSSGVMFSISNVSLDGTATYDTNVQLLDEEKTFTILFDANITSVPSGAYRFFYDLQTASPYYGIQFGRGTTTSQLSVRWGSQYATWDGVIPSAPYRIRLAYTHSTSQQTYANAYQRIDSAGTTSKKTISNGSYLVSTSTLKSNGPSNTWWTGTINRMEVLDHVLTDAEIDTWFEAA